MKAQPLARAVSLRRLRRNLNSVAKLGFQFSFLHPNEEQSILIILTQAPVSQLILLLISKSQMLTKFVSVYNTKLNNKLQS